MGKKQQEETPTPQTCVSHTSSIQSGGAGGSSDAHQSMDAGEDELVGATCARSTNVDHIRAGVTDIIGRPTPQRKLSRTPAAGQRAVKKDAVLEKIDECLA